MIKEMVLCSECYQPLSNPICGDCLAREIVAWLEEKKINEKTKKIISDDLKNVFNKCEELESRVRCIICGKESVFICTYCLTRSFFLTLKKFEISRTIQEDFLSIFSYWKWYENFEHRV